jgi:hypothetical protein
VALPSSISVELITNNELTTANRRLSLTHSLFEAGSAYRCPGQRPRPIVARPHCFADKKEASRLSVRFPAGRSRRGRSARQTNTPARLYTPFAAACQSSGK